MKPRNKPLPKVAVKIRNHVHLAMLQSKRNSVEGKTTKQTRTQNKAQLRRQANKEEGDFVSQLVATLADCLTKSPSLFLPHAC